MRSILIAGAVFIAGVTGASAQWYGPSYGPPPPYRVWGGPPAPSYYGPPRRAYYDDPPPRRCWYRQTPWGPERVCRREW